MTVTSKLLKACVACVAGRIEPRSLRMNATRHFLTLDHVFNHGTHHRGQITAALTALGQPSPELDLVYFLQQQA